MGVRKILLLRTILRLHLKNKNPFANIYYYCMSIVSALQSAAIFKANKDLVSMLESDILFILKYIDLFIIVNDCM